MYMPLGHSLLWLIMFSTTFTITSFTFILLSAIIRVRAVSVLSARRFDPSLRLGIWYFTTRDTFLFPSCWTCKYSLHVDSFLSFPSPFSPKPLYPLMHAIYNNRPTSLFKNVSMSTPPVPTTKLRSGWKAFSKSGNPLLVPLRPLFTSMAMHLCWDFMMYTKCSILYNKMFKSLLQNVQFYITKCSKVYCKMSNSIL